MRTGEQLNTGNALWGKSNLLVTGRDEDTTPDIISCQSGALRVRRYRATSDFLTYESHGVRVQLRDSPSSRVHVAEHHKDNSRSVAFSYPAFGSRRSYASRHYSEWTTRSSRVRSARNLLKTVSQVCEDAEARGSVFVKTVRRLFALQTKSTFAWLWTKL